MPTRTTTSLLCVALLGCAEPPVDEARARQTTEATPDTPASDPPPRPEMLRDSIRIEGMAEPITLELFRTPDDFPIPFSAYVPEDLGGEVVEGDGDGAGAVRFVAEFGGARNERALLHLFVQPEGTTPAQALAVVRAYEAGTGVPVSRGLEPLGDSETATGMQWADRAYDIRYQAGGSWYLGSIGLGSRQERQFHLIIHYPAEYGDGFIPRTELVLETWRWADGSPLRQPAGSQETADTTASQENP